MAEVELECAVYGEGTVFPVKIARDAKVSALQEAIFYKKRYNHQYKFDSSALTLYLARKEGGAWLKHDRNTESFLQGGIDTDYDKMLS
uniref:Crinkler effector protein N-terminal domain-containing protein n=1 Tax=Globisporangium ultimum (strain ATCC 200006 / CBS 805.95 / DAOM BR144) TaxID=431595 RepID=K3XDD0_GLOUD